MPEPTARQSHIDRALTNVAIAYSNAAFVWPEIFPRVPVQKQSDKFFKFDKEAWFDVPDPAGADQLPVASRNLFNVQLGAGGTSPSNP